MANYYEYLSGGVRGGSGGPSSRSVFKITYNGLLARSGATAVVAHVGFNSGWENVVDYPMEKTPRGFEASVFILEGVNTLNVCFRDPAGNWDNNSGANYTFRLESGAGSLSTGQGIWNEDLLANSYYWRE